MGNCLKHESSPRYTTDDDNDDLDFLSSEGDSTTTSDAKATTTEVKIRITKKQLEALLNKVDMKDLRVEQVLAQLMNHSDGYQSLQRSWRPALQSIPELN